MENKNSNQKLSFGQFLGILKWLIVFNFKLSKTATTFLVIIKVISELSVLFNAYIFARILDKIIKIASSSSQNIHDIIPLLGALLVYNLILLALDNIYEYYGNMMNGLYQYKATLMFYKQIYSLGIQTLENPDVVNKIQRTKEVLSSLNSDLNRTVFFIARLTTLFSAAFVIFKIMPMIVAIVFIAVVPGFASNRFYMKKSWKLYKSETENKRKSMFAGWSLTETSNIQEITITSAFKYLSYKFENFANRYMAADFKIMKGWMTYGFLFGSITEIASIFGYFSILRNLFNKLISVGDVTFQMRSLDIFISNLSVIGNSYVSLYERSERINEVKQIFDMKPMVSDGSIEFHKFEKAPKIKFENVSFKYPNSDDLVIKNLNFEIKPGEKIAIVGENGAGKTTLVKLLCRFYKTSGGEVLLNGESIDDIKIGTWYKNLGVLFQDYNAYAYLSLKENIFLGNSEEEINMAKVKVVAEKADVSSFAENYKHGYEQILSEKFKGGTRPSSGQWQKIAIARFFYRNSPVVIFDEPTAAIDPVSEAEIFGQIYDFFKDKTVIIISHRFSTVRNADKIYVMDHGEVIESGSHSQLMKLKGKYYKAFNIQAKGYK